VVGIVLAAPSNVVFSHCVKLLRLMIEEHDVPAAWDLTRLQPFFDMIKD